MAARARTRTWAPEQLTATWQAASLLLAYPEEELMERLPVLTTVAQALPATLGAPLRRVTTHLDSHALPLLQESYVETFDARRRNNLYLTYFVYGDTRKRGGALLRFKQTYLASGLAVDDSELPDHLCVVLEYAATHDREAGRRLLLEHRAGLELLRIGLREENSGWSGAVEAVCATLPPLKGEEHDAVRRLVTEGPPAEEVGLAPYDPSLTDPRRVDLPMPSLRGV